MKKRSIMKGKYIKHQSKKRRPKGKNPRTENKSKILKINHQYVTKLN